MTTETATFLLRFHSYTFRLIEAPPQLPSLTRRGDDCFFFSVPVLRHVHLGATRHENPERGVRENIVPGLGRVDAVPEQVPVGPPTDGVSDDVEREA